MGQVAVRTQLALPDGDERREPVPQQRKRIVEHRVEAVQPTWSMCRWV